MNRGKVITKRQRAKDGFQCINCTNSYNYIGTNYNGYPILCKCTHEKHYLLLRFEGCENNFHAKKHINRK